MKKSVVKRLLALSLVGIMAVGMLAGCGGTTDAGKDAPKPEATEGTQAGEDTTTTEAGSDEKVYNIGVLQLVQHDALDASNEGFFKALEDKGVKYKVDQQNAAGETSACQTIAQTLVDNKSDLIFSIATPAAQAVAGITSDIPIIVTAVTDPAESGLCETNEMPGTNVTGTSDLTPIKEQMDLLKEILPETKTVGILYCSAESNSEIQAKMAREALDALGIAHEDYVVSSSNEIQSVVESAIGKVDALYAPTDNVVAAAMSTVAMIATENKIPVICGEEGMVKEGGLATYGIDYFELGYKAGEMAADILLNGANPAEMPIGYLEAAECKRSINLDTAEALGLDINSLGAE